MNESSWTSTNLGEVTAESRKRAGNDSAYLARTVYGVDRAIGLNPVAKYTANSLEKYKVIEQGMFAYNPMRLNIGSIGYCSQNIQPGLVSPDYVVFECNPKKLDPGFLNYYISSAAWSEWTSKAGVGSVRMRIYYRELARLPILLPPIPEQCAIAEILSALDDVIDVNCRMNDTLESTARAIFRKIFVNSEESEEWEEKTLDDITSKITKGTTPTTLGKQFTKSGIKFIKVNSITDNHQFLTKGLDFIDEETNTLLSRSIIENDDVLLTIAGTIGRVAKVPYYMLPANTNQAVAIIRGQVTSFTKLYSHVALLR